jgi:dipeptidyl aminopeptidase/acylaminoacyl peptidase
VLREKGEKYVDPGETHFRILHETGDVVWTSERDGWNHIYLSSLKTGELRAQLTQGPWVVRQIVDVDEKARRIYFLANGREKDEDLYQTHLYVVGFDGKGFTLLTPENATHTVSFSPGHIFIVDNFSRPDLPAVSSLRRTKDGSQLRVLEQTDTSGLAKAGWKAPEPFDGKAKDGATDLYGLIWKPSNFDPSKKYPIVEQAYTGPQGFFVPKTFAAALRNGQQQIAELGFIAVMVDGRGTTGRSRAFHEFSYHNLGGAFDDHVEMIKQMAAKFPYMDIDRVGIYGTSAGGYGSTHAILTFPDFYKVCVSISGDHDARLDKAWWNELYQGYPVGPDYAEPNVTIADHLKGHLLIEHGDMDDNVHVVETMRLTDALINANKNFDQLIVPNMYHGEGGNPYLIRRRWDYFVLHLLGVTPPPDFAIHEDGSSGPACPIKPFKETRL